MLVDSNNKIRAFHLAGSNSTSDGLADSFSLFDYMELYKWYAPGGKSQESYRLVTIANVEIG